MAVGKWLDPKLADEYANKLESVDWYEHEVNMPSLMRLMPSRRVQVLDFGCGPGNFTKILSETYDVTGCDASPKMVELAREALPGGYFMVWDGAKDFPNRDKQFDVVFSKLTVHFLDDLDLFAEQLNKTLKPGGEVIFSVPHPLRTVSKVSGRYYDQAEYDTEIGAYGLHVTMVHRSLSGYLIPFLEHGYILTGVDEPRIMAELAEKYHLKEDDLLAPKRLNLRFQKTK